MKNGSRIDKLEKSLKEMNQKWCGVSSYFGSIFSLFFFFFLF